MSSGGPDALEQYRVLARYNRWMNEKLYALAATLSEEERRRDLGAFFGSVHATLNHLLLADRAWLGRLSGEAALAESRDADGRLIRYTSRLDQELYADFATLRRERARTDADLERFVVGLVPERLAAPLVYRTTEGTRCEHPCWWALSHLFNHQTHHRGQVTTLLRQLGRDPGVTDLVVMLRSGD